MRPLINRTAAFWSLLDAGTPVSRSALSISGANWFVTGGPPHCRRSRRSGVSSHFAVIESARDIRACTANARIISSQISKLAQQAHVVERLTPMPAISGSASLVAVQVMIGRSKDGLTITQYSLSLIVDYDCIVDVSRKTKVTSVYYRFMLRRKDGAENEATLGRRGARII